MGQCNRDTWLCVTSENGEGFSCLLSAVPVHRKLQVMLSCVPLPILIV